MLLSLFEKVEKKSPYTYTGKNCFENLKNNNLQKILINENI